MSKNANYISNFCAIFIYSFCWNKTPTTKHFPKFLILSVCMYVQCEYLTILHSFTLPIDFGSRAWCIFLGFKSLAWRLWAILHPELEDIWLCFCYLSVINPWINHHIFCNQTNNCSYRLGKYRAVIHIIEIYPWLV